jgi:hypothetical protein
VDGHKLSTTNLSPDQARVMILKESKDAMQKLVELGATQNDAFEIIIRLLRDTYHGTGSYNIEEFYTLIDENLTKIVAYDVKARRYDLTEKYLNTKSYKIEDITSRIEKIGLTEHNVVKCQL